MVALLRSSLRRYASRANDVTPGAELRPPVSRRVHVEDWCVITALPLVLTALNDSWIFGRPVGIDRWIYSGLHLHLPVLLRRFPNTYYVSREPWDFLGWAIHRILPAEPALYVLHLSELYFSAFALYVAVRLLFSSRFAALTATALLCVQSTFLVAVGWDYVDGFYVGCLVVTIAALFGVAVGSRWTTAAVIWGIAATWTVSTYALWAVLVIVEIAAFVVLNRHENRRPLVVAGAYFLCGALGSVVALGLLNLSLGGGFLYFWPQVAALGSVAANNPRWFVPVAVWANQSPYAIASAATWLYSIAVLGWTSLDSSLLAAHGHVRRRLQIVCGMNLAAVSVFAVFQLGKFALFQFESYVDALLPFAFVTIGGGIAAASLKLSRRSTLALVCICYGIVLTPWILSSVHAITAYPQLFSGALFGIAWSFVACCMLLLGLLNPQAGVIVGVSVFAILGFDAVSNRTDVEGMSIPENPAFKQQILAVFDASTIIGKYDASGTARFWFNAHDPFASLERDVNSTYLAAYTKINERFPDPRTANAQEPIEPGDRIVIMTSSVDDAISRANRLLAARHIVLRRIATEEIQRPTVVFRIIVANAELDPKLRGDRVFMKAEGRSAFAVTTPPVPWAYGTLLQMPRYNEETDYRDAVIRLKMRTIRGRFWIGVLTTSGKSFLARKELAWGSQLQDAVLTGINLKDAGGVVIQNGPFADAGRAEVYSAEIVIPKVNVVRAGHRS